jgi:TgpA N-terminal domain
MTTPPGKLSRFQSESTIRILQFLIGAVAIGLIFWQLQSSTSAICCGDFDGYYHVQWTRELWHSMKSKAFPPAFPWLPLTTLDPKGYVDHHLLFHIFQIPFVASSDPRLGAKIASAFFGGLAVLSCYWLLLKYRVRYPLVWLIALLACSAPFLFRMNMAKAPPLAIVYLIVAIYLFFQRKYWPLLPLGLIFTWTYDLFVLLVMATVFWIITIAITEVRIEWRPLVYVLAGCAAGLILNPYFPHNLQQLVEHMKIKLTVSDFDTKVGSEWYPYDSWEFLGNSAVACIAMLAGYIAFEPSERKRAHYPIFFLLLSTALMIMTARWKRIAEYWPPFAVLFAGFSLNPWLHGFQPYPRRLSPDILEELKPFFDREEERAFREMFKTAAVATVALALSVFLYFNLTATEKEIAQSEPHDHYRAGATWLKNNVPPGQIIFNTDWDDFPRLFYYDPSHYYVSGLDPSYLFDKNPELSSLYDNITLGKEEDPGPLIRDRFGARYVFSDNDHHDFFDHARASGWFDIVYEDTQCTIMYIRDEKLVENPLGEPGNE